MSQIIEELLLTGQIRREIPRRLEDLIENPAIVDPTFSDFGLETEFFTEVEILLASINEKGLTEEQVKEEFSIISVDIDDQSSIAITYGNRVARSLSQQAGARISGKIHLLNGLSSGKVFHVSADRYYLLLTRTSLEAAHKYARQLKVSLEEGEYRISPAYVIPGRPALPGTMLELPAVTVHLSVSSYPLGKLKELLGRYPDNPIINVRALVIEGIEAGLRKGRDQGGHCIISWDPDLWDFVLLE